MAAKFRNDYSVLAHPRIIDAISKYSDEVNVTYGLDYHSENAAKYIKNIFGASEAEIFFLSAGTQTNLVFISSAIKHYEGVIAPDTGHINVHETAAIAGNGYTIIPVKNNNGKITAKQIRDTFFLYDNEHMVKPKMVYISNSTEFGTIYKKEELKAIYETCKELDLYLYIDGARLGNALTSNENDLEPSDIGKYSDAFYVGGAKNGMMIGEALVINNKELQNNYRYHIKNKGAMLSKGYLIGIEFEEAFKDGLYFELAKHSNDMALKIKEGFKEIGINMLDSPTNQIFATFSKKEANTYIERFDCEKWSEEGNEMTIRFVTSFATTLEEVDELLVFVRNTHK